MARQLTPTSDIQITVTPRAFGGGTGAMLSISQNGNERERVCFAFTGRLMCVLPPKGTDPNRYALSLSVDGDENADLREWLEELRAYVIEHVAANVGTIFPNTPGATADFIRSSEFRIVREFDGGHSMKLRYNCTEVPITIPNPKAQASDTKVSAMKVPASMQDRVLVKGARVSAQAQLAYVFLDDQTADFGLTINMTSAYVTSAPPRRPLRLADFAPLASTVRFAERKRYKTGQGSYAAASISGGGYPLFALNSTIGEDSDALRVTFDVSAGKDKDVALGDPLKSFSVDVPAGTALAAVLEDLNALVVDRATEAGKDWFPSSTKMTRDRALMNFTPPYSQKGDYTPTMTVRVSPTGRAGDATKVWIVPDDAPTIDLVDAVVNDDHGYQKGALEAIKRDTRVSVVGHTSCAWIQEKKFGYSFDATHIFIHRGSSPPLMDGDREVLVSGEATADDIMAHFGKRPLEPDGEEDDHAAKRHCGDGACATEWDGDEHAQEVF